MYVGIVGQSGNNQPHLTHGAEQNTPANPTPPISLGSNSQETDPRLNINTLSEPNQNSLQSDITALYQLGQAIGQIIKPRKTLLDHLRQAIGQIIKPLNSDIQIKDSEIKRIKTLLKEIFAYSVGTGKESPRWKEFKNGIMDEAYGSNDLQELPDILQELSDFRKILLSMKPPSNMSEQRSKKITDAETKISASEASFKERQEQFNQLKRLLEKPQYPFNIEIINDDGVKKEFQIDNPLAEIEVQNPLLRAIIHEFKNSVALKSSEQFINPNSAKELKENLLELAQKLDNISTNKLGVIQSLSGPETLYFTGCSTKPSHIQITNLLNADERFKLDSQLFEIITTKALEYFKTINSKNNPSDTVTANIPANRKPSIHLSLSKETKQEKDFLKIQITNILENKKPQNLLQTPLTNKANSQPKDTELLPITDPLLKTAQELLKSNGGELKFQVQTTNSDSKNHLLEILYPLGGEIS